MTHVDNSREEILALCGKELSEEQEERVANLTSMITCGYGVGEDNSRTIEKFFDIIIAQVDAFLAPISEEEQQTLPNGVMRRLTDARRDAEEYRAQVKRMTSKCATCLAGCGECAMCAEPD